MSFELMQEDELLDVAASFAVDLDDCRTPKGKLNPVLAAAAIAEEGVTYDMWEKLVAARVQAEADRKAAEEVEAFERAAEEAEDLEPVEDVIDTTVVPARKRKGGKPNDVLVKMERQNPYYEVAGKTFTSDHPFVVMTADEAQQIFDFEEGFRIATPREASEYYS
jgi:hypothetical protein